MAFLVFGAAVATRTGTRDVTCGASGAGAVALAGRHADGTLVLALPRGRILDEVMPLVRKVGLVPEPAFDDSKSRKLLFDTNRPEVKIVRVRSFDVATFVAFGAAQLGVAGNDVLMEFEYPEIYAPVDLGIGKCHMAVAEPCQASPQSSSKAFCRAMRSCPITVASSA